MQYKARNLVNLRKSKPVQQSQYNTPSPQLNTLHMKMVPICDHQYLQLLVLIMFLLKTVHSDCVSDNSVEDFPSDKTDCCQKDEWLVKTKPNQYRLVMPDLEFQFHVIF